MIDQQTDTVEDHVGLTQSDGIEQTTSDESVTARRLFIDGGDGKEKEATFRSHHAGASSEAPPNSGIPSAMTQSGVRREAVVDQDGTPMAGRVESLHQDTTP